MPAARSAFAGISSAISTTDADREHERGEHQPGELVGARLVDRQPLGDLLGHRDLGRFLRAWRGQPRRGGRARRSLKRLLDQPLDQLAVGDALELRLLGNEAERSHARLGVHLEQIDARPRPARRPSGSRNATRLCSRAAGARLAAMSIIALRDLVGNFGRADVLASGRRYISLHNRKIRPSA